MTFAGVWEVVRKMLAISLLRLRIKTVHGARGGHRAADGQGKGMPGSRDEPPPGEVCREPEAGMLSTALQCLVHAESSQPRPLLNQCHYFGDTYKGKFPVGTAYEATGPQRRRNLSAHSGWGMPRMLFPCSQGGLPASAHQIPTPHQLYTSRDDSPGSVFNSFAFIYIQIRG